MPLADTSAGSPRITGGLNIKMDENGKRFLLEKAAECRRRAERAPTENVRKLSLKMAEQLAWYARPDALSSTRTSTQVCATTAWCSASRGGSGEGAHQAGKTKI
jgi:hypothetical protein